MKPTQQGTWQSDNAWIYYELYGDLESGLPPIICCNGVGVSRFFWKYITSHYHPEHPVLLWDYRGHGKSDRDLDHRTADMSIERHAEDLAGLYQHLTLTPRPAILIGHSMGCQVSIEFAHRYPALTKALVLLLGTAGRALETFGGNPNSPKIFKTVRALAFSIGPKLNRISAPVLRSRIAWPFTIKTKLVDPLYTEYEDFRPYLEHLSSMDILLFLEAAWQCQLHDAWEQLPEIAAPLLMIAAENDAFTPLDCAERLVAAAQNAELMVLADGSHAALIEQPQTINHRIDRFLKEHQLFS